MNYVDYFEQCAALFCTYTVTNQINFSNLLALLLSIYGGLTAILRLAAPVTVILVAKLKHRSLNAVANGGRCSLGAQSLAGCTTWVATLFRWVKRLNVFKSGADRTEEAIHRQRLTTRSFLILLAGRTLLPSFSQRIRFEENTFPLQPLPLLFLCSLRSIPKL